ncbi:hypothetical protein MNV84_08384 [Leishmania braziliensis]|nr:hypothetical protein MNV84_08384 [Leishmania braziliensis]
MADTFPSDYTTAASRRVEDEEGEQARRATLTHELSELEHELREATQRVDALQTGSHALAIEVAELDRTLTSLRIEVTAACQQKSEAEAQVQQTDRGNAVSIKRTEDIEEEVCEYRTQCVQHHQQQVEDLMQAVQTQQRRNATLRREWEAAVARDTRDDCQASVTETLLLRVQDGARHLKRCLMLQCSRTVAESARLYLTAARQQRAEVFANDMAARARTLAEHRSRREAEAAAFHDVCRRNFQERADTAFGAIKALIQTAQRLHNTERHQRVADFQCQLAAMTKRSREMLEEQVRRRLEQECAISITQQDAAAKEWAARQEDLAGQIRAFRLRAEMEVSALRESHGMHREPVRFPSQTPTRSALAQEVLPSDLDRVRLRMEQLALSLRVKQEQQSYLSSQQMSTHAVNHRGTGGTYSSGSSPAFSFSVEQISEGWQHSLLLLQHSRETLRRSISELKEVSHGWAPQLHQRRTQVTQQREHVKAVRSEWEQAIRGKLSRCLTSASPEVPNHVGLTTGTLSNLKRRVGDILQAQQSLRAARANFTAELSMWSQSLGDYRIETERLLADVFQQLDLLREGSGRVEVDQLALQSFQAQLDVLGQHVTEEANRLARRKQRVDAFVKNLQAGSCRSHTLPGMLNSQWLTRRHKGSSLQVTDIFSTLNKTSAIRDAASPAGMTTARSDADHQMERAKQRAMPLAATTKEILSPLTPKKASPATKASFLRHESSSTSHCDSDCGKEGWRAATTGITLTAGPVMSDVYMLDSHLPSSTVPALDGNHARLAGMSDGGLGGGAYVSDPPAVQHTSGAVNAETVAAETGKPISRPN